MLARHKAALSQIKSAQKQLKDARTKHEKAKRELAKTSDAVRTAKARLVAAQEQLES